MTLQRLCDLIPDRLRRNGIAARYVSGYLWAAPADGGDDSVKIGHGRHYADVPPVRGVYQGTAGSRLDASVQMTRLDPQAGARA